MKSKRLILILFFLISIFFLVGCSSAPKSISTVKIIAINEDEKPVDATIILLTNYTLGKEVKSPNDVWKYAIGDKVVEGYTGEKGFFQADVRRGRYAVIVFTSLEKAYGEIVDLKLPFEVIKIKVE